MSEDEQFQAWLEKVCQREIPQNPMGQVRTLAKELAEGATQKIWDIEMKFSGHKTLLVLFDEIVSSLVGFPEMPIYETSDVQRLTRYIAR